jgi:hypothetical protein
LDKADRQLDVGASPRHVIEPIDDKASDNAARHNAYRNHTCGNHAYRNHGASDDCAPNDCATDHRTATDDPAGRQYVRSGGQFIRRWLLSEAELAKGSVERAQAF